MRFLVAAFSSGAAVTQTAFSVTGWSDRHLHLPFYMSSFPESVRCVPGVWCPTHKSSSDGDFCFRARVVPRKQTQSAQPLPSVDNRVVMENVPSEN